MTAALAGLQQEPDEPDHVMVSVGSFALPTADRIRV